MVALTEYEVDAVVEVIEQLVSELGPEAVPDVIDVDLALNTLRKDYGSEEEGTDTTLACAYEMDGAKVQQEAPGVEPVTEQIH